MSLLALIVALFLEQAYPLSARQYLHGWLSSYAHFFQMQFNTGRLKHGKIAWVLATAPLIVCIVALYQLLHYLHPFFAWTLNVLMLYLTMGFRQSSHFFTDIHQALRNEKLDEARNLLSQWRGRRSHELNTEEIARVTIEQALIASQRNVFGVIVWFVLFSALGIGGAAGALLYRLTQFLCTHWSSETKAELAAFGWFARRAFYVMEWLPVRLTAMTFAIVGDFEDTVYCWRTQSENWPDREAGILLASGAGALGVRLGMPLPAEGIPEDRPELGMGDDADTHFLQSTIGLVWRALVFWLILLLLLSLANLLG
jgi:adenosylcobinamide-phosphate synthase